MAEQLVEAVLVLDLGLGAQEEGKEEGGWGGKEKGKEGDEEA